AVSTFTSTVVPLSSLTALTTEIGVAQTDVHNAVIGTVPDDYSQSSVDALNAAITTASEVTSAQAQSDVDAATSALTTAVSTFTSTVVPLSSLTALTTEIGVAQTDVHNAVI